MQEISIFCNLFYRMLSEVSGKEYKLKPKAFLVDDTGATFAGIKEELCEEVSIQAVFTCQW